MTESLTFPMRTPSGVERTTVPMTRGAAAWFKRYARRAELALVGTLMLAVSACHDAAVDPGPPVDRAELARVLPAVTDARLRLALGLDNTAIRERVVYDLHELEVALSNGDTNGAQFRMRLVASVLADYQAQPESAVDRPDVTGILLAMNAVTKVLGNPTLPSIT